MDLHSRMMNKTFTAMAFMTLLLYSSTVLLFNQTKCIPHTFNPITNNPALSTLLCNT